MSVLEGTREYRKVSNQSNWWSIDRQLSKALCKLVRGNIILCLLLLLYYYIMNEWNETKQTGDNKAVQMKYLNS